MARAHPHLELAHRLLERLRERKSAGNDFYPVRLDRLARDLDPTPGIDAVRQAAQVPLFKRSAIVAFQDRADSWVALAEDRDLLAQHPDVLIDAVVNCRVAPPWKPNDLAKTLATPLKKPFTAEVQRRITSQALPASLETFARGRTILVYPKDRPPAVVHLARRLLQRLHHERTTAAAGRYPASPRVLLPPDAEPPSAKLWAEILKFPEYRQQIVSLDLDNPEAPIAFADDLDRFARSSVVLNYLLHRLRKTDAHAFPVKQLTQKLKPPVKAAITAYLQADDICQTLPEQMGFVLISQQRWFFALSDLHQRRPSPSVPAAATRPAPSPETTLSPAASVLSEDFRQAFDAAFERLDAQHGHNNLVSLVDLRKAFPYLDRAQFDQQLYELRRAGWYRIKLAETYGGLSAEEQQAAIHENGEVLLNVSRNRP